MGAARHIVVGVMALQDGKGPGEAVAKASVRHFIALEVRIQHTSPGKWRSRAGSSGRKHESAGPIASVDWPAASKRSVMGLVGPLIPAEIIEVMPIAGLSSALPATEPQKVASPEAGTVNRV